MDNFFQILNDLRKFDLRVRSSVPFKCFYKERYLAVEEESSRQDLGRKSS